MMVLRVSSGALAQTAILCIDRNYYPEGRTGPFDAFDGD
jgi:hypothetical protein